MNRYLALLLSLALLVLPAATYTSGSFSGGKHGAGIFSTFVRQQGLQTNVAELARFVALSGSGQYATDRAGVKSNADTAVASWPYDIQAGAWEDDDANGGDANDDCEPVGDTLDATAHDLTTASTDILAMALTGVIENTASYHTAAATRLRQFSLTTGFELANLSGSNQCILDMSTAAFNLLEAAQLIDEADLATWTDADRVALATWASGQIFPLVTWAAENRKNNWAPLGLSAAIAIAAYGEGHVSLLVDWASSSHTPTQYISDADGYLDAILSSDSDAMDSQCVGVSPFVYGLQSHGGYPDELRRTTGTSNCGQTSLAFACPSGVCDSGAGFYQSKFTNGITRTCEALRRIDGDGARCFEKVGHHGDDPALLDAIQFATGNFSYQAVSTTQGLKYVGGEYYRVPALLAMTDASGTVVRGGRDFAYTRLTHAPNVAHLAADHTGRPPLLDLSGSYSDRIPYANGDEIEGFAAMTDTVAELVALGWDQVNVAAANCANNGTDDFSSIQTAVNAAAEHTVIVLNSSGSPCVYNGTSQISMQKSNVLIFGLGWGATRVSWDRTSAPGNYAPTTGTFAISAPGSPNPGSSLTWVANFGMGTESVSVSDAGGTILVGDRILLKAADADGQVTSHSSVVTGAAPASATRLVSLADPLPVDLTSTSATVQRYGARNTAWIENVGIGNMEVDQTQPARVTDYNACESAVSGGVQTSTCPFFRVPVLSHVAVRNLRVERVRMLHVFNTFIAGPGGNVQSDHAIVRNSRFDELFMTYYRANNNGSISFGSPDSNGQWIVNNVTGDRNNRFATIEAGGTANAIGWNYQVTQSADDGTNTYCDVIATTGGLGRSIYWHGSGGNQSGAIVEANDMHCHIEIDGDASDLGRLNVLYRNRLIRSSTSAALGGHISSTSSAHPFNKSTILLNRALAIDKRNGGEFLQGADTNLVIAYNAAHNTCTFGMSGSSGGCTGTGTNASATYTGNATGTAAITVTASNNYPPSFLLSSPPSWWCVEACAWSDTSGPGAMESGSGTQCKLPAQILAEGGPCTPLPN